MPIIETPPADTKKDTVEDILDLLQKGEDKIIYGTNKDVKLLLGTSGSGKSTFTQFIAGYDDNLISKETGKNTREYIIIDKNDKIGNNTFVSKTIFPELVLDTETNAAFYDCPGFSDTRSPAHDIAATYFIKKVIDHAERVKLVFSTNYPSVREGVDRQAFLTLVKNAVEMIKNITKFDHSIALVVTKVDNIYDTEENENGDVIAILRPDESIIESIATFLKQLRDYLQSQTSNEELDSFNAKAVEFVDALLHKKDEKYANIGIFRRPNKAGVLTNIKLLQDRKPYLKKIIYENIQFNAYDKNDFGYTISPVSQNYLHDLITTINKNIVTKIVNIGQEIEKYYNTQEASTHDIQYLYNKFRLGYDSLSATKISALSIVEPQQLTYMITKNVIDLNISVSNEHFQNITNHLQYLKFIKTIDGQSTVMKPEEWTQALTNVIGYLNDSQRWYNFLINFYDILSKYEVQRDYHQYSSIVDSLKYHITINENNSEIVLAELKQFLDKVSKEESEREFNNIKDVKLNKSKLEVLTDLLNLTIKYNVDSSCDGDNLIVKGQYIRLKDISSASCKKPKFIEIFALNKVFIDTTLNKTGDQVQLSIIAPTFEIIGSPSIVLNGSPGASSKPEKAKNATSPGANGDDGKPGEPGGPTGHFLSITQNVANSEYLKLSIIGGKGGTGQEGGDGKEGNHGMVPHVPKDDTDPSWGPDFDVKDDIKITDEAAFTYTYRIWNSRWWVYGQNCTDGGNGGDGGVGGKGGNSVDAVVINLIEDSKFAITTSKGENGTHGSGGKGAEGGERGQLLILDGYSKTLIFFVSTPSYQYTVVSKEDLKECSSGHSGLISNNTKNMIEPTEIALSRLPSAVINDYKNYMRNNLSGNMVESFLRKFYDDLERHKSVEILYNVFGFVNELQGLEDQFYTLRKKLSHFFKGFKIQEDLARCIEKLEEGMTIMINMYDRIEDYHDKAELADYIANINNDRANQIHISDPVLRREVDNLRWIIQSNLVLAKYETGMDAFRQHIYPFAEYFIPEFDLPSSLIANDTNTLVATSTEKINVVKSKLIESKITITKYDKFIHSKVRFNGKEEQSMPFFVWKNNKHKNAIKTILEGKEITIKSDIKQGLNKNAIKFNTIGINFKLANGTLQNELNKQLEGFKVEIIHMGTSYYRCENKFYMISSDNQTISYTFARNRNGDPIDSNEVYKKLEKYEPLLSPYTLWNVKISHYSVGIDYTFNSLEKYKDEEIDLELEGTGQYVDRGIDVCNEDLNKYYVVDDTISEIDNIDLSKKTSLLKIPAIKSFSTLSQLNAKYIKRKRRSVDKHEPAREININTFATSGACSNMKSSFINNIFNLIGSGLVAYEYLNPLNKIGQWFTKEEKTNDVNEDFMALDNGIPRSMKWVNIQSPDSELPAVSHLFINHESSTVGSSPNSLMFCNNGNLLLLDLIIRRKNGIKYQNNKDFVVDQKLDSEFAESLAYHAYAPKI